VCVCARMRACVCVCVYSDFSLWVIISQCDELFGVLFSLVVNNHCAGQGVLVHLFFPRCATRIFFFPRCGQSFRCATRFVCVCVCVVCRILPYHLYHRTWRLLQCVAVVRCSVLQRVAAWCSVLSWDHTLSIGSFSRKHSILSKCSLMFMHCNTLQRTAEYRLLFQKAMLFVVCALQHSVTHCNTLQHTATHSNALQHTATHCSCFRKHTLLSS